MIIAHSASQPAKIGPASPADLADPSLVDIEVLATALDCDLEQGLSAAQAARRLATDGPNVLRARPPVPGWRRFAEQFHDPLIYVLLGAILVSLLAWFGGGRLGWPIDVLVIAVIVLINAILGFAQESRADAAVAALARMSTARSSVVRGGHLERIPSDALVRGDLLVLAEGDAIGADARLFQAAALRVQEASLTGESEAVLKDATTLAAPAPLADRLNMVFKGTAIVQGTARAIVTATGMSTQMGAIANLLESAQEAPTPLQAEVRRIGRMLGVAVCLIAAVVVAAAVLIYQPRGAGEFLTVLLMGVSLAVAAVPEGLPAILSVVLGLGVQRMARRNAIVKKLSSVEALGSASVIASDKTGTLTRAEMTIERILTASGMTRVTGVGYRPQGQVQADDGRAPEGALRAEQIIVLGGGSLANNAALRKTDQGWEVHGDPTEAAFLVAERKLGGHERRERRFERIGEIPFTSMRKMMSTIELDHEHGGERVLISKGAPDVLLAHCSQARVGDSNIALDQASRARIVAEVDELTDAALRTLSVAYRTLADDEDLHAGEALEHDLVFVGTVGIIDPPRPEAAAAISEAHQAGIRVLMITGDHPGTAARIAADLGITAAGEAVLTGAEIDAMDDAALARAIRQVSVYARVAPAHKMRIIDALQAGGEIVAMTGDGVNDAPALKAADIGVAMGITGTEVTREAARMILADDNFGTIVAAVREGRVIFENIRKVLRYLLSSNMGEVFTVFFGVVLAGVLGLGAGGGEIVLPLLATQILWVNLVTDSGPALAMGIDPQADDVMARCPRRLDERVIDLRMWAHVIEIGAVMAAVALLSIDLYLPGGLIEGHHELANARTAGFTVLVFAQLFNCLGSRSENLSAFRHLFVNAWLWAAILLSVMLQVAVVQLPVLNTAFGTAPLSADQWLTCMAIASLVLWFTELRKLVTRTLLRRARAQTCTG